LVNIPAATAFACTDNDIIFILMYLKSQRIELLNVRHCQAAASQKSFANLTILHKPFSFLTPEFIQNAFPPFNGSFFNPIIYCANSCHYKFLIDYRWLPFAFHPHPRIDKISTPMVKRTAKTATMVLALSHTWSSW
jgi:hypothetical protein